MFPLLVAIPATGLPGNMTMLVSPQRERQFRRRIRLDGADGHGEARRSAICDDAPPGALEDLPIWREVSTVFPSDQPLVAI